MGNADKLSAFKQKQSERLAREAELLAVLTRTGKTLELDKREKKRKKRTVDELMSLVDTSGVGGYALRSYDLYTPVSYNLDKQIAGLINFLFVKYPVPSFLYQAFQRKAPVLTRQQRQQLAARREPEPPAPGRFEEKRSLYRQWFVILAQGSSFPKAVKGLMTSREACLFLSAPAENEIHENVWWARMRAAGIPGQLAKKLVDRLFSARWIDDADGRLTEVIQFYARFHADMDKTMFAEISDFIDWKLSNDRRFRMKGRTLGSVIKLTNEWHLLIHKAHLGAKVTWEGFRMPLWYHEAKTEFCDVIELCNNKELMNEGRKQRHCVYSYVNLCVEGRSSIFSVRRYLKIFSHYDGSGHVVWDRCNEISRVTVEVNRARQIVQVRGPLNRRPSQDEARLVRMWAGEKGFTLR